MSSYIIPTDINKKITLREIIKTVIRLSIPAILAEISSIIMQYIDAAMVGSLGAEATASIGIVSSSMWLLGGFTIAVSAGFSVQTAQFIGAGKKDTAKNILRQSIVTAIISSLVLMIIGVSVSGFLPRWLGAEEKVCIQASKYFLIYSLAIPAMQLRQLSGSMLQSSGDMKTPGIMNTVMCILDVIFNFLLIFPNRTFFIFGKKFMFLGAGMGVGGAALASALSEICAAIFMMYCVCFKSEVLKFEKCGRWLPEKKRLITAAKIAVPVALEHAALCGAQIASTKIVAPLGTVAVAANSLAVTAESFCYMPGYGIGSAAATVVGQSIGAGRKKDAIRFANVSVLLGTLIMSISAVIMFIASPLMFSLLTPVKSIKALGISVLRIEAFAEPMYAVSIVAAGAMRGAGDTFVPCIMNLFSMWGVRITSAAFLAPIMGLRGVWIAMCGELCIRGLLFLIRLLRKRWIKNEIAV